MKLIKSINSMTVWLLGLGLLAMCAGAHAGDRHQLWSELLAAHVHGSLVDYDGMGKDSEKLDRYLDLLADTSVKDLSRDEQFAFYVNAYNAWTVKLILSRYPDLDSIKDLGTLWKSPWKKKIARIDNQLLTLDNIEHDILRPRFKDPRVHFAINCAARSCPPLYREAFESDRLDVQLDTATKAFINDPKSTYLKDDRLYVSRIFKWFGEDFDDDPIAFVRKHARGDLRMRLEARKGSVRVKYLDYDWSLNAK